MSSSLELWMVVQQFPWEGVKSFLCYSDVSLILSRLCSSTVWIAFALEWEWDPGLNQAEFSTGFSK